MISDRRSPGLYKLMSSGVTNNISKGESVGSTSEGHRFNYVLKGYIKRYSINNTGSIGIQIVYGPEDVFSFTKVFRQFLGQSLYDGHETFYYEAMTDAIVLSIDLDLLESALKKEPRLYREMFSEAGYHLRTCIHRLENISLGSAYTRVAHQLYFASKETGEPTPRGVKIKAPLTHQDLADILGITRATVTLAMNKLRDRKILLPGRELVISDTNKLMKEVYPE